jgi:3-oxoacyl-[acyl-carrier-protein] synthase III
MTKKIYSKITGTGSYLPKKVLTNKDLEKSIDTTDEWIVSRSGIKQRHIVSEGETSASMGADAAKEALLSAQLQPSDIDLIIVATATPDRMFPSTACIIQDKLGCKNAAAFDVSAACTGFVYALSIADQFISNKTYDNILVIGTETISKILDWEDRSSCVLFGDGAGAVVLSTSNSQGIIDTHLEAMGEYGDTLYLANANLDLETGSMKLKMQGREVFKLAVNSFSDVIETSLKNNNIDIKNVDWLVPHQANIRIIEALIKKLDLDSEKTIVTLDKHANTSAASIPLALDLAIRDGRIQRGQLLLLAAFGGGITWGSAIIQY